MAKYPLSEGLDKERGVLRFCPLAVGKGGGGGRYDQSLSILISFRFSP